MRALVGESMAHKVSDGGLVNVIEELVVEARLGDMSMGWVFEQLFGREFEVRRRFTLDDLRLAFPLLYGCAVWKPVLGDMVSSPELVCVFYNEYRDVLDLVFLDGRRYFVGEVVFPVDLDGFVHLCREFLKFIECVGNESVESGGLKCC
jgi:hypothetical protein